MGCLQSLPLSSFLRSVFGGKLPAEDTHPTTKTEGEDTHPTTKTEGDSHTVAGIIVYVTVSDKEAGRELATSIIEENLAAFVSIISDIERVFQHRGTIQMINEELLIIQTTQSLLEALTEHVNANHYDQDPGVIALPIIGGSSLPNLKRFEEATTG